MTSIRRKSRDVLVTYQLIILAILAFAIAITWFTVRLSDTAQAAPLTVQVESAVPAPTATPTPQNHCLMLETGICYIVFPAHCVPGTPEIYGPESMGVPVTCNTVKGE